MTNMFSDYKRYKWFFTSSGKLVVGGKSAEQNDELLKGVKKEGKEFVVMHTAEPGSPFAVILSEMTQVNKKDLEESAVFTACFSRAWRSGKKKSNVGIFPASSLYKDSKMKSGTWGVLGKVIQKEVELKLVLTEQEGALRAVPEQSAKKNLLGMKLRPGKIDKISLAKNIKSKFGIELDEGELLSAVPSGGFSFTK